jgi:photosystem II stability/assembly factor-like uncharacterized protein
VGSRLLRRSSNQAWQDITPPQAANSQLLSAFFLDTNQGWSVIQENTSGRLTFLTTLDAGANWQSSPLPTLDSLSVASASVYFIDSQNGWLSLKLVSSSNFSLGVLYKTTDGGKSWKSLALPSAGPVYFLNTDRGWIAGGPTGDKLYQTQDGGATWQPVSLASGRDFANQSFTSLPVFTTDQDGWLELTVAVPLSPHIDIFNTMDTGDTWTKRGTIPLDPALNPASPAPSVLLDENRWVLASPGKPAIYTLQPAGLPAQTLNAALPAAGLPVGVIQIQNSSRSTAWALV